MTVRSPTYLPAAGHDWALPFYDPLVKLLGLDATRMTLLDQAGVGPRHRVLDIGCGTGTLAILIKRHHPGADVVGLDPDPKALGRARRKAEQASVCILFDQGFSDRLSYPDAAFDRVFSSFMFHHLPADARVATLREAGRVLKPGGSFHLLDFAGPRSGSEGTLTRLMHSHRRLHGNAEGQLLALMGQAGFGKSRKVGDGALFFGAMHIAYYQATMTASATGDDCGVTPPLGTA